MNHYAEQATMLGKDVPIPHHPDEALLDAVPNPQAGTLFLARFTCPEFTSLCPVTGQPDFGHLVIDYAPDQRVCGCRTRAYPPIAAAADQDIKGETIQWLNSG